MHIECKIKPNSDFDYTFSIDSHQTEFRLVLNKSVKCNYNPNSVLFNQIKKIILCVDVDAMVETVSNIVLHMIMSRL